MGEAVAAAVGDGDSLRIGVPRSRGLNAPRRGVVTPAGGVGLSTALGVATGEACRKGVAVGAAVADGSAVCVTRAG